MPNTFDFLYACPVCQATFPGPRSLQGQAASCPNCHTGIICMALPQTPSAVPGGPGAPLPLDEDEPAFVSSRPQRRGGVQRGATAPKEGSGGFKLLVVAGYVGFVLIPIGITLWFLVSYAGRQGNAENKNEVSQAPRPDADGKDKNEVPKGPPVKSKKTLETITKKFVPPAAPVKPNPTPDGPVYRSPEALFASIPEDAYPKSGADANIERAAAKKWANEKLVGRTIEVPLMVREVSVTGEDPFTVVFTFGPPTSPGRTGAETRRLPVPFGGEFLIGGQACRTVIKDFETAARPLATYDSCPVVEAKAMRALKGRELKYLARIEKVVVESEEGDRVDFGLWVTFTRPTPEELSTAPAVPTPVPTPTPSPTPLVNTVAVAPMPHEARPAPVQEVDWWAPMLSGYSSEWKTVGAVDVRVSGLAVMKVPITDSKKQIKDSEHPMLVVVLELRKNSPTAKRNHYSWQWLLDAQAAAGRKAFSMQQSDNKEVDPRFLAVKLDERLRAKLPLPEDGTPVRDFLLFSVPGADADRLKLKLNAERFGESGEVVFELPEQSWIKK